MTQDLSALGSDLPDLPQVPPRGATGRATGGTTGGPRRRFASLRAIAALVLREMSTTNGRSPGGYLWAILEPAAGIALLTIVPGRATRLQGGVHLVLLAAYLFLSAKP